MLNLKNVTLFNVDVADPEKSTHALLYSMNLAEFGDVVLATDLNRWPGLKAEKMGIRLYHTEQSDEKIAGPSRSFFKEYEDQNITLPLQATTTEFVLSVEWDACVLNPSAWDDAWFKLDYIGALWSNYYEPGWPPTRSGFRVGNGGFSLRSRRFCLLAYRAATEWKEDPGTMSYDQWICRTMRPWLETNGMVFGTEEQALKFSCEDTIYAGQFGFHGKNTVKMNGWTLDWMK
jgi:hypothetical protein